MHIYKGAEFWKDAAVKYLDRNVLNVNGGSFLSKWWQKPKYGFEIFAFSGVVLTSILAFFYIKNHSTLR